MKTSHESEKFEQQQLKRLLDPSLLNRITDFTVMHFGFAHLLAIVVVTFFVGRMAFASTTAFAKTEREDFGDLIETSMSQNEKLGAQLQQQIQAHSDLDADPLDSDSTSSNSWNSSKNALSSRGLETKATGAFVEEDKRFVELAPENIVVPTRGVPGPNRPRKQARRAHQREAEVDVIDRRVSQEMKSLEQ